MLPPDSAIAKVTSLPHLDSSAGTRSGGGLGDGREGPVSVGVAEQVQRRLEDERDVVLGWGVDQAVADVVTQVHAAVGVGEEELQCSAPIRGEPGGRHVADE